MTRRNAPFSPEEVATLNDFQFCGMFHPFTCPRSHIQAHGEHRELDNHERQHKLYEQGLHFDHVRLVALSDGLWHCPAQLCDYTQDWAHEWMADGSWREVTLPWLS